jgi:polysaccharide pyruvyl transferase WcaK-like protein
MEAYRDDLYLAKVLLYRNVLQESSALWGAMKIAIYSAISASNENKPIIRDAVSATKVRLHRAIELARWKAFRIADFHYYLHEDRSGSNVGDIAIRIATEKLLQSRHETRVEFLEVQWGELDETLVSQINTECGGFVVAGGGYFFLDGDGDVSKRLERDQLLFDRIKVPKIIFAAGVNFNSSMNPFVTPKLSKKAEQVVGNILKSATLTSVRDHTTAHVLKTAFAGRIEVIPDPALMLQSADAAITSPMPGRSLARSPRIGLNLAFHGPYCSKILSEISLQYCQFLKTLSSRFQPEFVYFAHSDSERAVSEILKASGVNLVVVSGTPEELLEKYRTLDVHISQMLHSSILAVASGVPTINMAYDVKNPAFFELVSLQEFCVPILPFNSQRLESLVDTCLKNAPELKAGMARISRLLSERMNGFVDECTVVMDEFQSVSKLRHRAATV